MARPRKYPPELLDRGARLVFESNRPIAHVARDLSQHRARAGFEDQVAGRRLGPAGVTRTTTCAAVMRFPARRLPYRGCPRTARLRPV